MDDVLYLEPDEEITSVVDKLKRADARAVSLVLPKNAQLVQSAVNVKLLKREAERLKKRIAFVTQDATGIHLATQAGIPVYASVTDSTPIAPSTSPKPDIDDVIEVDSRPEEDVSGPESPVPVRRYDASEGAVLATPVVSPTPSTSQPTTPPPAAKPPRRSRRLLAGALMAALVGGGAWFFFVYPRATIVLGVATDPVRETVEVIADNNIEQPNTETGHVPGQKLQAERAVKEQFPATGSKDVGTKASGTVGITNRLGETLSLPAGTELTRGGLRFRSMAPVTVPAATATIDSKGNIVVTPGTAEVKVEAAEPGDATNVGPGQFIVASLSSAKQEKVTGANTAAFSGGESRTVKVVTEEDIAKAKQALADRPKAELIAELKGAAKDALFVEGAVEVEAIDPAVSRAPGDEAEAFEVSATVRARTIAAEPDAYRAMVTSLVEHRLGEGRQLLLRGNDALKTTVRRANYAEGTLTLEANVEAESVQRVDEGALKALVAGKGQLEAEAILKTQPGIRSAGVSLRPSFRQSVPRQYSQIDLVLERK